LPGGQIESLKAYNNSLINISGGYVGHDLFAYDSSTIYISGGTSTSYPNLRAYNSSKIYISGGDIFYDLYANAGSNIYVSGGTIGEEIRAYAGSTITFIGQNFVFAGVNVGYGEFNTGGRASVRAPLSWTLPNGDQLNYQIYFEQGSSIILIPEPATLLMLGLGGMLLRKRN
jgi:hypothetical protein